MAELIIAYALSMSISHADDFRSGAPLTEGRRGIFNAALLIYEEHNIRIVGFGGTVVEKTKDTITLRGQGVRTLLRRDSLDNLQ